MTDFKNARTQTISWLNEHGTFKRNGVTRILPVASTGDAAARWRRVGEVLQEVCTHAFANDEPLRVDGSRWSLSAIGMPQKLALSLAAHDVLEEVPVGWRSGDYSTSLGIRSLTPMLISGSMKIQRINRELVMRDLALQTSGASDGQTLAGATSTGTHGGAIRFGAVHDSIRAVHLMVGPNEAVLVQPASAPFVKQAETDLSAWLGFSTKLVTDDAAFGAALVNLGSLGLVLNLVVEVEPLYFLTSVTTPHTDSKWEDVLSTMSPAGIKGHGAEPWHLQVFLTPYGPLPKTAPRAWVRTMQKQPYANEKFVQTDVSFPDRPDPDLIGFVSGLANLIDAPIGFRSISTRQLIERYGDKKQLFSALPGVMFGPTPLPRGQGHSTEFAVAGTDAHAAVTTILAALGNELKQGRQHLGALGVRFVGGSKATLAPNTKSPSCFIELPTIRTKESTQIFDACADALTAQGLLFGCHWGQYLTRTKRSLASYWSPAQRSSWIAARQRLLPTQKARDIFASPILKAAGLLAP